MDNHYEIITKDAAETAKVGQEIAQSLTSRIICLYGELGSGKTTFTQGFAKGLGINSRLLSPTFIIVRRYDIPETEKYFYHIDLYRLKNTTEMEELGLSEIFADPQSIVVIEWAEKLAGDLPAKRTDIHFEVMEDGSHKINVRKVTT
jgi:tRNA threonylcarbamoyladenosine biosynthesis protein TsaE